MAFIKKISSLTIFCTLLLCAASITSAKPLPLEKNTPVEKNTPTIETLPAKNQPTPAQTLPTNSEESNTEPTEDTHKGANDDNLPLPRFASLGAREVNMRTGPGKRYPITWIYQKKGLPVLIISSFDVWRKIQDSEGTEGWVQKSMLSGKRAALIKGSASHGFKLKPATDSAVTAMVEPGVIATILECKTGWCRLEASGTRGWIEKDTFWGWSPDLEKVGQ
ncbi:MAG: SH3 domain-containing protein [Alphaproteobacteria bacterium]